MILIKRSRLLLLVLSTILVTSIFSVLLLDLDGDGLNGLFEATVGTNIFNAYTDDDSLNDGDEVNKYQTNPSISDSDGDGLDDYTEAVTYNTNPNDSDSNDDGFNDGYEFGITGDSDGLNDFNDENKTNSTDTDDLDEKLDDFNDENS